MSAEEVSIWDEPDGNIQYLGEGKENHKIAYGTVNSLVIALTKENLADGGDIAIFLLTYKCFTTSEEILQKLIDRYNVPTRKVGTNAVFAIQIRVLNFLCEWIVQFYSDFTSEMMITLRNFISKLPKPHSALLLHALQQGTAKSHTKMVRISRTIASSLVAIFEIPSEELARQLTLVDYSIYTQIKPRELVPRELVFSWQNSKIKILTQRYNQIVGWVLENILLVPDVKGRAKRMNWFIDIAWHLKEINNFYTYYAVLVGLISGPICRLNLTREALSKEAATRLNELQKFGSPEISYQALRKAHLDAVPPCMYYIGLTLTNITFVWDGNAAFVEETKINFSKYRAMHELISNFSSSLNTPYPFKEFFRVTDVLRKIVPTMNQNEQYQLSRIREKR